MLLTLHFLVMLCWWVLVFRGVFLGGGGGHCEFCGKDGEQDSIDEQIQYFHHHSVCVWFFFITL